MLRSREAPVGGHVQQQRTARWQLLEPARQKHHQLAERRFVQQVLVWVITHRTTITVLHVPYKKNVLMHRSIWGEKVTDRGTYPSNPAHRTACGWPRGSHRAAHRAPSDGQSSGASRPSVHVPAFAASWLKDRTHINRNANFADTIFHAPKTYRNMSIVSSENLACSQADPTIRISCRLSVMWGVRSQGGVVSGLNLEPEPLRIQHGVKLPSSVRGTTNGPCFRLQFGHPYSCVCVCMCV